MPGKIAVFKDETYISTLLGSCVAVAIFDPVTKIGGLNHYLLPENPATESTDPRYGVYAIPLLIEECLRLGALQNQLRAKVYGGANVINFSQLGESVGKKNIEIAERLLKQYGIPVMNIDVGGSYARTLKMNTATFEIMVKASSYNNVA